MSDFKVSPMLYQQITALQQRSHVSAGDLQQLRQVLEQDGLALQEQALLEHLQNKASISLTDGIHSSIITLNCSKSVASQMIGKPLGQTAAGAPLQLGVLAGNAKGYASEHEAISAFYQQGSLFDKPDLALLQDSQGAYFLYQIDTQSTAASDLSGYKEIRDCQFLSPLPGGFNLVAVASDNCHVRFYGGEGSPSNYPTVAGPVATDGYSQIESKAQKALERLHLMESELSQTGDHRGVFVTMFRTIAEKAIQDMQTFQSQGNTTAAMLNGQIALDTAVKFFEAYDHYAAGQVDKVPEAWRQAFDAGRLIEANQTYAYSTAEILGLSLNAHLLHDLPLTLQEIGFNPQNPAEVQAYNDFNSVIVARKNQALQTVAQTYGLNDVAMLNGGFDLLASLASPRFGSAFADGTSWTGVAAIRHGARLLAENRTKSQIVEDTTFIADTLRSFTPGGN